VFNHVTLVLMVLYESAKFQLSISSTIGLAFLDKHATYFRPPGAKFSSFRTFIFGFDHPSISLPNFSFLPRFKMQKKTPCPISDPPRAKFPRFHIFFLWSGQSFYKSAKYQFSTSSRRGLVKKMQKKESISHFGPPRSKFSVSDFSLWFRWSFCKSAKFQLPHLEVD
jgi:hypothetical protein